MSALETCGKHSGAVKHAEVGRKLERKTKAAHMHVKSEVSSGLAWGPESRSASIWGQSSKTTVFGVGLGVHVVGAVMAVSQLDVWVLSTSIEGRG